MFSSPVYTPEALDEYVNAPTDTLSLTSDLTITGFPTTVEATHDVDDVLTAYRSIVYDSDGNGDYEDTLVISDNNNNITASDIIEHFQSKHFSDVQSNVHNRRRSREHC